MRKQLLIAAFMLTSLLSAPSARAAIEAESCSRHVLTPEERTGKADLVFKGKVTAASCKCMALAAADDSYGPKVECSDLIDVIKTSKGATTPQFILQNFVMIDADPKATFSKQTCEDMVEQRNKKLIGENDIYYIRQDGDHYQSIPISACD